MIYSRSAEYAIRAFIHMAALKPDEYALVKDIAAEGSIPEHFLAKILQQMVREGYLKSSKGPHGGFRLRVSPEQISLRRIVEAVDGAGKFDRCVAGNPECNENVACGMHDSWVEVRSRIIDYLEGTNIADLAKSLGEKRLLLSRPRRRERPRASV